MEFGKIIKLVPQDLPYLPKKQKNKKTKNTGDKKYFLPSLDLEAPSLNQLENNTGAAFSSSLSTAPSSPLPTQEYTQIHLPTVSKGSLPPVQCQQKSPVLGAVKTKTLILVKFAKQRNISSKGN